VPVTDAVQPGWSQVIVVSWRTVNFDLHLGFPQAPAAFQLSQLRTLSFRR